MNRIRRRVAAGGRAGSCLLVLTAALLFLTGCKAASTSSPASPASASPASARAASVSPSPALSIPGTHQATATYQTSSPVSTLVVISHLGDVSITGGSGPATSVTEQSTYSKTPPVTTRTLSGRTLTVTYSCPVQVACDVSYLIQVPRDASAQVTAGAGSIRLSGLAGSVTAKTDVGFISAAGLTGESANLTTGAGGISAAFAAAPSTVRALARVGAITVRVPGSASYQVSVNPHVGKATVSIPQSSSSARTITASTDVGAILIAPSP